MKAGKAIGAGAPALRTPTQLRERNVFLAFVRALAKLGYTATQPVNGAVVLKHQNRVVATVWPSKQFARLARREGGLVAGTQKQTPGTLPVSSKTQHAQDKRVRRLIEEFRAGDSSFIAQLPKVVTAGVQPPKTADAPRTKQIQKYSNTATNKMWAAHERQKLKRPRASKETHGLQARRWKTFDELDLK